MASLFHENVSTFSSLTARTARADTLAAAFDSPSLLIGGCAFLNSAAHASTASLHLWLMARADQRMVP